MSYVDFERGNFKAETESWRNRKKRDRKIDKGERERREREEHIHIK